MLRARDWRKFQGSRPDHSVPAWRASKANNDTCSHCLLEQKARTFAFGTLFVHTHSQVPLPGSIPAVRSGGPLPRGEDSSQTQPWSRPGRGTPKWYCYCSPCLQSPAKLLRCSWKHPEQKSSDHRSRSSNPRHMFLPRMTPHPAESFSIF